jgi:eukaryotic-like serine/threonine-protein kinase
MARIHIARSIGAEGFSRLVAAKRLDPQLVDDAEFVEMFLDEARIASKIHHRNVVPVLDVVRIEGEVIMVQELVHGAPLHKLFARAQQAAVLATSTGGRIPIEIAVSIAMQTLCGLHAAHEALDETGEPLHIVHRDVSPQNIMIATDGTARLLDFGVAKTSAAAHVTHNGTFKGKLAYSAPEQLRGKATRQTDVYASAIVLWELLTCERLHVGRTEAEIFTAIVEDTPPAITQALAKRRAAGKLDDKTWAQLQALEPILQKAFARDLEERYATAADMEQALGDAVQPASLGRVAAWLRTLAQDMLDETDQLIAAEEASWRKAQSSGCMPPMKLSSNEWCRPTTSLETEAAIPSARLSRASLPKPAGFVRRRRRVLQRTGLAIASGIVVALIVVLAIGRSSSQHQAAAAPLPPMFVLQASPPPAPQPKPAIEVPADAKGRATAKRRPVIRRAAKAITTDVAKPVDCSSPFYYEGNKKIFKPACL